VLVGGGPAAWRCAFTLRHLGYDGPVTVVSDESRGPYDRTMVSKDCLSRVPADSELALSTPDAYDKAGVTLRLGAAATRVDPERQELSLSDGETLPYESLVIATGGRPRVPEALRCEGVHVLRNLADAAALAGALAWARRVVIVGGGFIAGEVATVAAQRGLEVIMLEALAAPLARVVGPEIGQTVARLHRDAGVDVRVNAIAHRVHAVPEGHVVELRDGCALSADVVVVATGMAPAVDWLEGTPGLTLDDGVVTDDCCRAGPRGVYAAGDCARWLNRRTGTLSRVEHWDTATRHGEAVAATIVGAAAPFVPVPFVWSVQQGARLQWVGEAEAWDDVEIEHGDRPHALTARFMRAGQLCAGFAIDEPRAIAGLRRELTQRIKHQEEVA
jgi:3-phenylpropionate/trans-cinnamate dioxygenase ferredoxin reductase subunit